jgi:hypothetical protein
VNLPVLGSGDAFGGLTGRGAAPVTLADPGFEAALMTVMEAMFAGSTKGEHKFATTVREPALHKRVEIGSFAVTPVPMS